MTTVHEPPPRPRGGLLASSLVRVIGLWILAGALFKLLQGSPNDLPPVVKNFAFPSDMGLKYKAIIGIELAIVAFALLRPRWGWILVALQLLVFVVVLVLTLGQPSCGCFGSAVTMPPWLMLTIDGVLLAALLATRPWKTIRGGGLPVIVLALVCAVGVAAPWFHDREVSTPPVVIDGVESPPTRGWVSFDLHKWEGQLLHDTPLANYVDPNTLPDTGLFLFWRSTCDHCARHLERLAETDTAERMIVLLRLREPGDTEGNRVVHTMPEGSHVIHVALPDTVDYVITTPAELEVEQYMVISGAEAVGLTEEELREAEAERGAGVEGKTEKK